ncbi:MAG: heavy metal-associated domain-containing protein [Anaerovoracaceae bacterium]
MKRSFKLENLDCANCAAKMEKAINKLNTVEEATISFMAARLTITADDQTFNETIDKAQAAISKVESNCKIKR